MAVTSTPPQLTPLPPAPLPTDAEAVFDAKAGVRLTAEEVMVTEINTSLTWTAGAMAATLDYKNAAATSASAAADSASAAATQANLATTNGAAQVSLAATQAGMASTARQGAEDALASTQVVAAAAQAAAGLPSFTGHDAFDVLQIDAAKSGVQWGKVGQVVGDIIQSVANPGALYLPADGSIYMKSAYPLLAAAVGTIGEKNFGTTFSTYAMGQTGISISAGTTGVLWAAGSSTVRKSTNSGVTWAQSLDLAALTPSLVSADTKGTVFVALSNTGNTGHVRTANGGTTWSSTLNINLMGNEVLTEIKTDNAGVWLVSTTNYVARSTDDGLTWASVSGLSQNMIFIKGEANVWYAYSRTTANTLSKSTDNGVTWISVATPVSTIVISLTYIASNIWTVLMSASVKATTLNGGIYVTTNNMSTWTLKNNVKSFVNGFTGLTYSAVNGFYFAAGSNSAVSTDLENWTPSSSSTPIPAITDSAGIFYFLSGSNVLKSQLLYFYDTATQFRVPKLPSIGTVIPYIKSKVA